MRAFVGSLFSKEKIEIHLSLSHLYFLIPSPRMENSYESRSNSWDRCGYVRHNVRWEFCAGVRCVLLDTAGAGLIKAKPAAAIPIRLGTQIVCAPVCLLPTNSLWSEKNKLVHCSFFHKALTYEAGLLSFWLTFLLYRSRGLGCVTTICSVATLSH